MIDTKTILLGSVLKPIDDTRMYEKLGRSLAKNPQYRVSIFGLKSSQNIKDNKIDFYPQTTFPRMSFSRLKMRLKFYKTCLKVKPDIIVVNTHELLGVMCLFRILFGCKAIYDVQENYFSNILYGKGFFWALRPLLAIWVRFKETVTSLFISHFWIAERSYEKELGFIGKRYTILENKFSFPDGFIAKPRPEITDRKIKLLYTGTISEVYGIFDSIEFFKKFSDQYPGSQLTIIGFSASKKTFQRLKTVISSYPDIKLIGGDQLVPHHEILEQIQRNDLTIVPYQLNPSILDCFPTKIWEYMSLSSPFIIRNNLPWVDYCKKYNACIDLDLDSPDWEKLEHFLHNTHFYQNNSKADFLWSEQEKALFDSISNII